MTLSTRPTIRFANYLSSLLQETYAYIAHTAAIRTGYPTRLTVEQDLSAFARGQVDVGFLCGLLYVLQTGQAACPVELLAAPVLTGTRYQEQPIYFSDVVVRADSRYTSFADLQGCCWAYNEGASHSGCNLVNYSLLERQLSPQYFARLLKSGSHLQSLRMVLDGEADATAIDSHVLDVALRQDKEAAAQVRTVAMLGPSAIPPVIVAKRLDPGLKRALQEVLVTLHQDAFSAQVLREGGIERFVPVQDEHYDSIRHMYARVQATDFPQAFH